MTSNWNSVYERVNAELDCQHERKEIRLRTLGNGTEQISEQCLTCGRQLRTLRKREFSPAELSQMPAYDPNLADTWHQRWRELYDRLVAEQKQQVDEERRRESAEWWASYDVYLRSPEWAERRRRVLERDQWRCRAGLPGCAGRATTVHHLNYKHRGNEPLFDLVAVCRNCHDALHDAEHTEAVSIGHPGAVA